MEIEEPTKRINLDEARDRIMDQIYYCLKEPACVLHLWNYVLGDEARVWSAKARGNTWSTCCPRLRAWSINGRNPPKAKHESSPHFPRRLA